MVATIKNRDAVQYSRENALVLWFEEVGIADIPIVGGRWER
jgi:hypothetical protein